MRLILATSLLATARAWGALGHMLVAQIARDSMQPESRAAADVLVDVLAATYDKSPDFVTAAVWADDLKSLAENMEAPLHFIDVPYVKDNVPNAPYELNVSSNPWAINQGVATLRSTASFDLDRARALRFVLHFVGDIHQPLHATSLYSNDFPPPDGDLGGNYYLVSGSFSARNLHSLWDGGLGQWATAPTRPLTPAGNESIIAAAEAIEAEFPASQLGPELAVTDPFEWTQESFAIAKSFVYTAPQSKDGDVPQSYLDDGFAIAKKQVAIGGYRLALLLDSIFAAGQPAAAFSLRGAARKARAA